MSVINKMLADLDARQDPPVTDRPADTLYQGIRPVTGRNGRGRPLTIVLVVVAAAAGGLFAWDRWGVAMMPEALGWKSARLSQPASATAPTKPLQVALAMATEQTTASRDYPEQEKPAAVHPTVTTPVASAEPPPPFEQKQAQEKKRGDVSTKPVAKTTPVRLEKKNTVTRKRSDGFSGKQGGLRENGKAASGNTHTAETLPSGEEAVLEKKARPLTAEEEADVAYEEGARSLKERRLLEAEQKLRLALDKNPRQVDARELLVGLMLQRSRWTEAEELLQHGRDAVPEHYRFVQLLARIYVQRGSEQKALPLMEQMAVHAKADPDYLGFLATLYQRAQRHREAIEIYSRAVKLQPHHSQWWLGLAISLEAASNWDAARRAYARAINGRGLDKKLAQYAHQRLVVTTGKVASGQKSVASSSLRAPDGPAGSR